MGDPSSARCVALVARSLIRSVVAW